MSSPAPRVDVGIVTWNTRDLSVDALRRLCDSEQAADLRVLVHDNASTDGTADAIATAVPAASIEVAETNLGFAAGVNRLIARSDAPWLLLLNSDAWPAPGAVGALVACATAHPRAAATVPRLVRPDGALEHSTYPFPSPLVALAGGQVRRGRWARRRLLPGAWSHDEERAVDWAVGAAMLLRRAALDEIGGFDERFFMYAEDLEWCHRAHRHGWQTWFTPAATVVHVGNASGEQRFGDRRDAAWVANSYRFYRDSHGPVATLSLRLANATGATVAAIRARAAGDRDRATYWRRHAALHLRRHRADRPA